MSSFLHFGCFCLDVLIPNLFISCQSHSLNFLFQQQMKFQVFFDFIFSIPETFVGRRVHFCGAEGDGGSGAVGGLSRLLGGFWGAASTAVPLLLWLSLLWDLGSAQGDGSPRSLSCLMRDGAATPEGQGAGIPLCGWKDIPQGFEPSRTPAQCPSHGPAQ